ncbi:hypothetical protein [Amycolatopsis sp. BJA-103]|uniref:hypothetical protein n=1 Tax=Amycolatopsis sp. BJA-103 TaxID=1911175 RepID=UPI000C794C4D|nr:hypothetical protein [Amycolatopsis sp. BJA-103]AUI63058.1 hypothetical protein BKN51_36220 [Amycolatopsis sp. BJA-103]PNE18902.1 hypothetical protein B1H26_13920 [Amycolatopsis sp. BJA-103]
MKKGSWGDDPELLMENSDHGVIRAMRLQEMGVPSTTTYRRCGPGGPWTRLLPGIVLLFNAPPTREQQIAAAMLYGGETALLTGGEACRAYGLRNVPDTGDEIHLLVPHERKLHNQGFVVVERTQRMPRTATRGGRPLAEVTRATLDVCRRQTEIRPVRALMSEVVQREYSSFERLSRELAHGSQRGSAVPRHVLAELATGQESIAEIDARRVWARSGLPEPVWNKKLYNAAGEYVAKPDAWFDKVALAWEVDSLSFHLKVVDGFDRTLARNGRYAAAGVLVLQTLPSRLRAEPDKVVAELLAAHAAAEARARPDVRIAG